MPNQNDRRYNAEHMRREADGLIRRHGITPQTMPHINMLMESADRMERQNDREYPHQNYNDEIEMARRVGRPRKYSTRYAMDDGEYEDYEDDAEMRRGRGRGARRDRMGRYAEMDNEQPSNIIYPYYPHQPYLDEARYDSNQGMQPQKKQNIGFNTNNMQGYDKHAKHSDKFHELKKYYGEMVEKLEENEIPHAKMEAEKLFMYWTELLKEAMHQAKSPEAKQMLQQQAQQVMQKLQQLR